MWWLTCAFAGQLTLADEVRWAEDVEVQDSEGLTLSLSEGYVFSAVDKDSSLTVGYVFVGDGFARFPFAKGGEARAFANTLVLHGDEDPDTARNAVSALAWTEPFDIAMALGAAPSVAQIEELPIVIDSKAGVIYLDTNPTEVIVDGFRLGPARDRAAGVLRERVERLSNAGLDPRVMLAQASLEPTSSRWLAEIHTAQSWQPFIEPANASMQDQWLSFAHDPSAVIDDEYRDVVFVHGILDRAEQDPLPRLRVITGVSHERPALGTYIEKATVNVIVTPATIMHDVEIEALLTVRTDVPTRLLPLSIPTAEIPTLTGLAGTHTFEVLSVETSDGKPLVPMGAVFGPWRPAGDWQTDTYVLPDELPAGTRTQIRVRFRDQWSARSLLDGHSWVRTALSKAGICTQCGCFFSSPELTSEGSEEKPSEDFRGRFPAQVDLGSVVTLRAAVPLIPARDERFPAEIRLGTTLPRSWNAVVDGAVTEQRSGDGRWWIAQSTGQAKISFGRLSVDRSPPAGPFPEVQILSGSPLEASPAFLRSVIRFYSDVLPRYPANTLSIVQGTSTPAIDPFVIQQFPCQINRTGLSLLTPEREPLLQALQTLPVDRSVPWVHNSIDQIVISGVKELGNEVGGLESVARKGYPHLIERGIAQSIAARWWVGIGEGRRDDWIAQAAAVFYRDRFAAVLYPKEVAHWNSIREGDIADALGQRSIVPLTTRAEPWSGEVGGLLLNALAVRIGEQQVLRGLDLFLRGADHSTAALAAALSESSGVDVQPWFDTWIIAGARPAVHATWQAAAGNVDISVDVDWPLGAVDVPVRIETSSGSEIHWVSVQEGLGQGTFPLVGEVKKVMVDPDHLLLLRERSSAPRHLESGEHDVSSPREDLAEPRPPEQPHRLAPESTP